MKMSEEKGELFKAFSKFQGELQNAKKDKAGHGYKYADLGACIDVAKSVLAKNGLAVTQMLGMAEDGKQTMITMMTHESGQWMSSEFKLVEAVLAGGGGKNPAQQLGSAITYQRRYAFAAIIGLAQEDDDAAMCQQGRTKQVPPPQFNADEYLSVAAKAISEAKTLEQLKTIYLPFWKELSSRGLTAYVAKLEQSKDLTKELIESENK